MWAMSCIQIIHFLWCCKYLQRRSFLFEVVKKSPIQHVTRGTWLELTWGRSQNVASCRQLPGYWLVHYLSELKSTFAKEMSREWSEKYLRIVCETRISEKCKLISGSNRGGNCFVLFSINLEKYKYDIYRGIISVLYWPSHPVMANILPNITSWVCSRRKLDKIVRCKYAVA